MTKQNFFRIGPKSQGNKNSSENTNKEQSHSRSFNKNVKGNFNGKNKFIKKQYPRQNGNRDFNHRPQRQNSRQRPQRNQRQQRQQRPYRQQRQQRPFRQQRTQRQQRPAKRQFIKKQQRQQRKDDRPQQKREQKRYPRDDKKQDQNSKPAIKHNRIIIRNLVFDINEKHIQKLLSPYGKILQINIPKNPDNKGSKGFAFVQFQNRNNCLKAIKELNGSQFKGRNIILDESVSKKRYMESKINQEQENKNQDNVEGNDEGESGKIKLEEAKDKLNQKIQEQQDQQDQDEQNNQDQDDQNKQQLKQQVKIQKSQIDRQKDRECEIFIRNLPISVKQEDLYQFFRKYGKLKFAKVVMNKQSNISKGTAFIKFQQPEKAKQLIEYSKNYQMNLLGKNPNFKLNPAINLELEGTVLKLFPVQSRQNINQKIKDRDAKDKQRQQQKDKNKKPIKKVKNLEKLTQYDPNNKRNLKLALLGLNKITDDMKEQDQERFIAHERQKVQKLKNPNNSVSDRRIVFKYLKKDITEENIRNFCFEFLKQSKLKNKDLTYCKLMFESLQTKKSAGYAFVEFRTPQISLSFLEWIESNQSKLMNQPFICEFAIQDSRKLVKLQNRSSNKSNKPNKKEK